MVHNVIVDEPLRDPELRALIRRILADGSVLVSQHATEEMAKDDLAMPDCLMVLRAGWTEPPEFENGSWRYRVMTQKVVVVVTFLSESELLIVTAWRDA